MSEPGQRPAVSFVVPVYNEEGNVEAVHADITRAGQALGRPYEILSLPVHADLTDVEVERVAETVRRFFD